MLDVINAGSTELSRKAGDRTMILNCWEKSSPLIKELERTVNFAERKCGDLMQQLHFYKEYYEKWIHEKRLNNSLYQSKNNKKFCKPSLDAGSSSENELEKVNQYFYKKIRNKINEMNQEISQANLKMQNKFENCNSNAKIDYKTRHKSDKKKGENLQSTHIENKTSNSEPIMKVPEEKSRPSSATHESGENVKIVGKQSSKSVPGRRKDGRKKDFLPLKKRHSSLQRYKIRSKSLPQGVRRKFGFGGYVEVFDPNLNLRPNSRSQSKTSLKADSYISFKTIKSEGQVKAKFGEAKHSNVGRNTSSTARSLPFKVSKSKVNDKTKEMSKSYSSKSVKSESAVPKNFEKVSQSSNADSQVSCTKSGTINFCRDIAPSNSIAKGPITDPNLNHLMSKPNALIPFLRQPIPFIPCSSTSKSFNLGLNVQQVLSLIKHRRHSITLQTVIKNGLRATRSITDIIEPTVNTLFFSHTTTSHSQVTSALCPARSCIEDTFSIVTDDIGCRSNCSLLKQTQAMRSEMMEDKKLENLNEDVEINKFHRPEDVWVVEQPDNSSKNCKKSRSRCTCYPSKHCVDYQKVLREYTGWRGHKAASFSSETYSSYHPMITYSRPKLCPIPSQENVDWGFQENNGKIELMKVHNDLNNLNRRYSFLEEQITQRQLDDYEANAELDAMESELSTKEMEFKDIINFYHQLILLKNKLKSLRIKNTNSMSQTAVQQSQYQRPKKDPLRPTPSMALAKVLRKIQGLQDKIKLIDAP